MINLPKIYFCERTQVWYPFTSEDMFFLLVETATKWLFNKLYTRLFFFQVKPQIFIVFIFWSWSLELGDLCFMSLSPSCEHHCLLMARGSKAIRLWSGLLPGKLFGVRTMQPTVMGCFVWSRGECLDLAFLWNWACRSIMFGGKY